MELYCAVCKKQIEGDGSMRYVRRGEDVCRQCYGETYEDPNPLKNGGRVKSKHKNSKK